MTLCDMRSIEEVITLFNMFSFPEVFYLHSHISAARLPKHQTGAGFGKDRKEVKVFSKLPMIPFSGFFDKIHVLVHLIFTAKGYSVKALKHLILFISAPIGTGN